MDSLIVLISAALLIGFIVWWFFGQRQAHEAESTILDSRQEVEVTVDGGYVPNVVVLKQGVPANIVFNRKDPSGCFNEVMFPDFGIHETLPINERFEVEIDTSKKGEFTYACGMNMFHGKVVIK